MKNKNVEVEKKMKNRFLVEFEKAVEDDTYDTHIDSHVEDVTFDVVVGIVAQGLATMTKDLANDIEKNDAHPFEYILDNLTREVIAKFKMSFLYSIFEKDSQEETNNE